MSSTRRSHKVSKEETSQQNLITANRPEQGIRHGLTREAAEGSAQILSARVSEALAQQLSPRQTIESEVP